MAQLPCAQSYKGLFSFVITKGRSGRGGVNRVNSGKIFDFPLLNRLILNELTFLMAEE